MIHANKGRIVSSSNNFVPKTSFNLVDFADDSEEGGEDSGDEDEDPSDADDDDGNLIFFSK